MTRLEFLKLLLRSAVGLLILRALFDILSNYPDYFPPNFKSDFLEGREESFPGLYSIAFYVHIITSPFALITGLILLSETLRHKCGRCHRYLGRTQVTVLLLCVLPSSVVMSWQAYAGWAAGISFILLSIATGICAITGTKYARKYQFEAHRRWMIRCYVLICSAIVLRMTTGLFEMISVTNAEAAYIFTAWTSWLIPLGITEMLLRMNMHRQKSSPT